MLQIDQLVCLVRRPVSASTALRQAAHLLSVQGAASQRPVLHVISFGTEDEAAFGEAVREAVGDCRETVSLRTSVISRPQPPAAVRRAVQHDGGEGEIDLLVLDSPSGREAVPPLADEVTQALVEGLSRPIFLAGAAPSPASTDRILVPTDLSAASIHTLRHATELADGCDASVVLLHVIDTSPYVALTPMDRLSLGRTTLTEHRARRQLQQFLERSRPPEVSIRTRLVFGDPADCIARALSEHAVDLLVLASHGAGTDPEPSLGSVADRLLRRVTCPTLLVRAGDRSLLPARSDADAAPQSGRGR